MPPALRPLVPAVVVAAATALLMYGVDVTGSPPACAVGSYVCLGGLLVLAIGVPVWLVVAGLAFRAARVRSPLLGVVTLAVAALVVLPRLLATLGLLDWPVALAGVAAGYVVVERQLTTRVG